MSTVTTYLNLVKPANTENFSRATYNNNLDLIDANAATNAANAANFDKFAKGYQVESKTRTSVSGNVAALGVVENVASFTFKAKRRYRLSFSGSYTQTVANDFFQIAIQSCAVADSSSLTTGLTLLLERSATATIAGAGLPLYIEDIRMYTVDTTVQLKLTVGRTVGTGTWQLEAKRATFLIEDLGYVP